MSVEQVLAIAELSLNIWYGNIPITEIEKKSLVSYKTIIKYLSSDLHSISNKRKYISKHIKGVHELITSSEPYIASLQKQQHYEENTEKCDTSLGEICTSEAT